MDQHTRAVDLQPWLPWLIIVSALLVFGADFIFFDKVFLPMDVLQIWSPWKSIDPPGAAGPRITNLVNADAAQSVYPLLDFISRSLKDRHVPLWNPLIFLGLPTMMIGAANFAFNPLYVALLWAFETATAHSLALLINLALIASFSYLFFLRRGLSRTASLAGSMIVTFSGHLMAFLELALADFAFAGAVVSLYCYERSLAEPRMRFVLGNGIVLGLLLLGGSIQWVGFLVPLIGLYAVMRTIERWESDSPLRHNARALTAFFVPVGLGVLLALPTLLPLPEYVALSHRAAIPFEALERAATFYPERFATFLFPNFFGSQVSGHYFATLSFGREADRIAAQNYNELMVYMSVVTLPLVLLAYRVREYRWATAFWSLIIVGALAVAMKPPLLYPFLYHYVPGFNGMQATRVLILLPLPLAALAAIGMHGIQRHPLRSTSLAWTSGSLFALTGILIAGVIGMHVYFTGYPIVLSGVPLAQHFRMVNPDFAAPLLILGMTGLGFGLLAKRVIGVQTLCNGLLCLLIIDLLAFGLRLNTRVDRSSIFPTTSGLQFLTHHVDATERALPLTPRTLPYNTLMAYNIATLGGYASMYPKSYMDFMSAVETAEDPDPPILRERNRNYLMPVGYRSKLLPMLNVKYLVTPVDPMLPLHSDAPFSLVHLSDLMIFQADRSLPKAFAVSHVQRVENSSQAVALMIEDDFDPSRVALVEDPPSEMSAWSDAPAMAPSPPLRVSRPNSDQIVIDTTLSRPALVVVSEQFFPGWNARLDGAPTALIKVNAVLMGAVVPEGQHRLTLRYMPKSVMIGATVALTTLVLILPLFLVDGLRHSGGRPETEVTDNDG